MHEASLARGILRAVLDRLPEGEPVRILEVRGRLAESEALSAVSLQMHFDGMARGTAAQGARLALELVQVDARCASCGTIFPADHHLMLCPDCGGSDGEILGETGLHIDEIDIAPAGTD